MRRRLILKEKINDFEAGEYHVLTRNEIKKLIDGGAKWEREWVPEDLMNDDVFYVLNLDGKVTSYRYKDNDPTCRWLLLTGKTVMRQKWQQHIVTGKQIGRAHV